MPFILSRVIALGVAGWFLTAVGLTLRLLFKSDSITVFILGAGAFIFAFLDARFWNVLDAAKDLLDSDHLSAHAIQELNEKLKVRKKLLWARWYSSFLSVAITALCAIVLQFIPVLPVHILIAAYALGYCSLGSTFVLFLWMGSDYREFDEYRTDQRLQDKAEAEWEEEIKRMRETPRPDFSKDKHLSGYGKNEAHP
jgi:hypothetical protein